MTQLKEAFRSMNEEVALTTAKCCKNRDIPLRTIKEWANSDFWIYQCAALYASTGKPKKEYTLIIKNLCKNSDDFVKQLAKEIHTQQNNSD